MAVIPLFLLVLVLGAGWLYLKNSDEIFRLLAALVGLVCSALVLTLLPWPIHAVLLALLVGLDLSLLKLLKW